MAFYMPPPRMTKQPLPLGGRNYAPAEDDPSWIKLHANHVNVTGLYDPREDRDLSGPLGEGTGGIAGDPSGTNRRAVLALVCGLLASFAVVLGVTCGILSIVAVLFQS